MRCAWNSGDGIAVTTVSPVSCAGLADGRRRAPPQRASAAERGLDPEVIGDVVAHLVSLPVGVCPVEYALTATAQVPGN
jgi:NADP-dependent 3-hydroxy acid dehydrogenase YdfG